MLEEEKRHTVFKNNNFTIQAHIHDDDSNWNKNKKKNNWQNKEEDETGKTKFKYFLNDVGRSIKLLMFNIKM